MGASWARESRRGLLVGDLGWVLVERFGVEKFQNVISAP